LKESILGTWCQPGASDVVPGGSRRRGPFEIGENWEGKAVILQGGASSAPRGSGENQEMQRMNGFYLELGQLDALFSS